MVTKHGICYYFMFVEDPNVLSTYDYQIQELHAEAVWLQLLEISV